MTPKVGSEDEITTFAYETEQTTVTEPDGAPNPYYYEEFGNVLEEPATQEAAAEFYSGYAEISTSAAIKDMALEDHASILDSQLSQQLGSNYVSESLDPTTGDVQIGITSAGYEQTVEQDVDNLGLAEKTNIVSESASITQLEEAVEALNSELASLSSEGHIAIGVSPSADSVTLEESNALSSGQKVAVSEAVAKRSVPVDVTVSSEESLTIPPLYCIYASCTKPLRGGVRIQSATHSGTVDQCTAGYIATADYGGAPYLLTAGHCIVHGGGVGNAWYAKYPQPAFETEKEQPEMSPLVEIGDAHADVYGPTHEAASDSSKGDMGIIAIPPSSEWFHGLRPIIITYGNSELSKFGVTRNEEYKIFGTHFNANQNDGQIGFVVCASGTEPEKGEQEADCGMEEGFMDNGGVNHLEKLHVCYGSKHSTNLTPGASGGPVYKDGLAFGIVTNGRGCTVLYQGINSAEGALHVTILHGIS